MDCCWYKCKHKQHAHLLLDDHAIEHSIPFPWQSEIVAKFLKDYVLGYKLSLGVTEKKVKKQG